MSILLLLIAASCLFSLVSSEVKIIIDSEVYSFNDNETDNVLVVTLSREGVKDQVMVVPHLPEAPLEDMVTTALLQQQGVLRERAAMLAGFMGVPGLSASFVADLKKERVVVVQNLRLVDYLVDHYPPQEDSVKLKRIKNDEL